MRRKNRFGWLIAWVLLCAASPVTTAEQPTQFLIGGYDNALLDEGRLDVEISFTLMLNEVLEEIGVRAKFKIYDTFAEVSLLFAKGDIDAVFCTIPDCVKLLNFDTGLPMFSLFYEDTPAQEYVLVTASKNNVSTVLDLRRMRLSIPVGHDLGLYIANHFLTGQQQQSAELFFASIARPQSSETALIDLVFGKVEAALVTRNELNVAIELNPQLETSLSVLYTSPSVILNLIALSPMADPVHTAQFKDAATHFGRYTNSGDLLQLFGANAIEPVTLVDLEATLQFLQ